MRTGDSNLGIAYSQVMFNQAAPRDAAGKPIASRIFSEGDRKTILAGMLNQCDALDGLKDGMITNAGQCRFSPAKLQCAPGKSDGCLRPELVTAMERAFAGPKDKAGYPVYAPVPYDTGIVDTSGRLPGYLPTGAPGPIAPASTDLTIDIDARIHDIRADAGQRLTDTYVWTNLNTFLDRGGKMLFFHGISDPWFSALATEDYWQRAAKANGSAWADASRLYLVPGMGHCAGGDSFDRFDLLTALVDWVERGKPAATIIASRAPPSAAPARAPKTVAIGSAGDPGGERPMCPFPSYAHYVKGDPKQAGSFACRVPAGS
jgi:hypothetical protein